MSFQDSNQQPFPPPQQSWGEQGQQGPPEVRGAQPGWDWGQQPPVQQQQQQQFWGGQGERPAGAQSSWGAPDQAAAPGGSGPGWGWGSQQPQTPPPPPPQPGYGYGPGAGAAPAPAPPPQGVGPAQSQIPQGFPHQQMSQQPQIPQQQNFYSSGGYASAPGYPRPQSDFGSGVGYGPGPGYPAPGPQEKSGLATAALWLGILGGWALINLVVSILAINDTGPGKKAGRGKALAGLYLTLAWTVVLVGVALGVSHQTAGIHPSAPPKDPFTSAPTAGSTVASGAGTGPGVAGAAPAPSGPVPTGAATGALYLTGATDPGCVTVQNAFDTMEASKGSNNSLTNFVSALQTGAGQSRTAGSQIGAVASDWSHDTAQTQTISDMRAMETACGMTTTGTDPQ